MGGERKEERRCASVEGLAPEERAGRCCNFYSHLAALPGHICDGIRLLCAASGRNHHFRPVPREGGELKAAAAVAVVAARSARGCVGVAGVGLDLCPRRRLGLGCAHRGPGQKLAAAGLEGDVPAQLAPGGPQARQHQHQQKQKKVLKFAKLSTSFFSFLFFFFGGGAQAYATRAARVAAGAFLSTSRAVVPPVSRGSKRASRGRPWWRPQGLPRAPRNAPRPRPPPPSP